MKPPLLALVLVFGVAPVAAGAQERFRVSGVRPDSILGMYERPDARSPMIAELPWNARVAGFGCTNATPSGYTWCRVKYGGTVGWARRRYLQPE